MVLRVLSHWTWNVSTARSPYGTSCVITLDMKRVHCPLSLWYFVCYHIGHGMCPLSTLPMVLRVLSHWIWNVSTVRFPYGTSCVITLDMECVHCPLSLWYFVCYHIGYGMCPLPAVPMILRVLSHWTWKVSIVRSPCDTSCVITFDMKRVHCPLSLWYFVCYHIGHETCPLSALPMVLRVLSHWTWNVSTVRSPYGTSCVITLDMECVHCPRSLWYFMCYHIWHETCPLSALSMVLRVLSHWTWNVSTAPVPMVLHVLSHWTWNVSTVRSPYGTSCVITLDKKRVHCPLSLWYIVCYHIGQETCPLSLWSFVCYHIGPETYPVSTVQYPTGTSCVITLDMKGVHCPLFSIPLVLHLLSHWTWNVSSVHCSVSHWYFVCYHIGHERCPLSLWTFPCYCIGHETCCSGATSRPSWCCHKIVFVILPGLITISWQTQLQRKTKSHLVFLECADYISWQLFLFRLYILWQITTCCTLHKFTRFCSSALIL